MDLMEDVSFKAKYHKHKIRVKLWESDFMEKYGRKPNKNDIKSADMAIREAYKIYWKLKTRALDKSLTEITFCDETENIIFPSNNVSVSILQSRKNIHENKEKPVHSNTTVLQDSLPKSHSFNTEIASIGFDDKANIKEVWGQHLNIEQNTITKNEDGDRSSFQLSQKMFNPQSFSKRNPRKCSYTKISSKCKNELDICSSQLNEQNLIDKNSFDLSSILRTSLNEKLKIINEQQNRSSQATNTIQQFIKKCKITTCNKPLNESWLNRCFDGNTNNSITEAHKLYWNSVPRANSLECNVSLKETTLIQNLLHDDDKAFSDDEDYICNSDSEEERKNKRVRNFNKVVEDNDLQLLKRSCINNDDISGCEKAINYPVLQTSLTKINNMEFFKNVSKELDDKAIECAVNTYKFQESKNECKEGNDSSNKDDANRNKTEKLKYKESAGHAYKRKCDSFSNSIHIKRNYQKTAKETNFNNFNENKYQSKNNIVNEDKDNIENEVKQALYNIEFLDVVPRLPLNMTTSGNLITDFTRVLEPSSLQKESKFYTSFATQSSSKEKVEKKDPFGKFNENYVKINLKKKVFVRGKKSFNLSKYKRNKWKQRKKELNSSKSNLDFADFVDKNKELLCFKCGEIGHFAKKCTNIEGDNLLKLDEDTNTSSYPTLQEVDKIDNLKKQEANFQHKDAEIKKSLVSSNIEQLKEMESNEIKNLSDWEDYKGDSNMNKSNLTLNKVPDNLIARLLPSQTQKLCPVYQLQVDGSIKDTPLEVLAALKKFGHKEFRVGQEKTIMRILSGKSTLVTLATGSGKSLCYQLPAYIYTKKTSCIVLVISPLVSLMDDQVSGIPNFLTAACLHTNQTARLRAKVLENLKAGKLNILLISPETIVAGEKSENFGSIFREIPPIAFACIDEAHCISQWSHNFRPSYLMICKVLKEKLGVKTILGLTATATKSTAMNIVNLLAIEDGMAGVISERPLPSNLTLTISQDEEKEEALINLLRSTRFCNCNSIIVYCTRRDECVRISSLIRISLNNLESKSYNDQQKKKFSTTAEAYHAGLSAQRRKLIQAAFMKSEIRVIVATVAFGMGINKSNIRAVIHFNMPSSFESYVQEIGRAGRDGLPSYCHLFLNPKENFDEYELRRHINAHGVDRHTIRRLLQKIFIPCCCINPKLDTYSRCPGHEVAFSINDVVKALDISEETITTLLCYLELHPKRFIKLLSPVYIIAKVSSVNGPNQLKLVAQSSPPLAMAIAISKKNGTYHDSNSNIEFSVIDTAAAIGWDSDLVKKQLKNLEWDTVNGKQVRSAISVKFDTLGFRVKAPGDLTIEELDDALDSLNQCNLSQVEFRLQQLKSISTISRKFSFESVKECLDLTEEAYIKSKELKNTICTYFDLDNPLDISTHTTEDKFENEGQIIADIHSLISSYKDCNFTGRSVARIFHGIQSPNYPALIWSKCRFWRAHVTDDFNTICHLATREILKMK